MKRSKPIRRVNQKRKAARFAKNFGEKAAWIRSLPCCVTPFVSDRHEGGIVAAHTKSRGSGGNSTHLVPMCDLHHRIQHMQGMRTFQECYGINLLALAAELEARWHGKGSE